MERALQSLPYIAQQWCIEILQRGFARFLVIYTLGDKGSTAKFFAKLAEAAN